MTESLIFKKHVASKDEKKLVSVVTSVLICSPHVNEGLSLFWGTRTPYNFFQGPPHNFTHLNREI